MRSVVFNTYSQPIRNLATQPIPVNQQSVGGWNSTQNDVSIIPNGRGNHAVARFTRTGTSAVASRLCARALPTTMQKTTVIFWARSNVAVTGLSLRITGSTGTASIATNGSIDIGTEWTRIRYVFDFIPALAEPHATWAPNIVQTNGAIGDWIECTELVVVTGIYDGEYSDGNTPNWKWDGTANLSSSVGYPYTLESIAGTPTTRLVAPGPVASTVPTASSGMTSYVVFDLYSAPTTALRVLAGFGTSSYSANLNGQGGAVVLRTASNALALHVRYAAINGSSIAFGSLTAATQGRHVAAFGLEDGATVSKELPDNQQLIRSNVPDGEGFAVTKVTIASPTAESNTLEHVFYAADHSESTMRAVNRWFANKYGIAF